MERRHRVFIIELVAGIGDEHRVAAGIAGRLAAVLSFLPLHRTEQLLAVHGVTELERLVMIDQHPIDALTVEKGAVEAVRVLDFPTVRPTLQDGVHGRYPRIGDDYVGRQIAADIV
nr:hypothetical protein [Nocardia nova]